MKKYEKLKNEIAYVKAKLKAIGKNKKLKGSDKIKYKRLSSKLQILKAELIKLRADRFRDDDDDEE